MNISYNWLKQYLDFDLTPDEVSAALTSLGLEVGTVEEVESIRGGLRGVVIGHVLTCEPHPNSDHLHITTVDLGDGTPTQIVCGAPNVAAGQTVVVATVGTTLYHGDEEFKIKKSKIRGTESFGMICAEDEIGVGASHDGIIVIDEAVKPGTPAAEHYKLTSDYVLEVDLTPNRIDAASHYGVARDLAAYLRRHTGHASLHRPSVEEFQIDIPTGGVTVTVENPEACIRYSGITIEGVTVGPSPDWLRNRLETIGIRSINNVVDVTNYILHAMGQPLHCFDRAHITDDHIVVRSAHEKEEFTTLDCVDRRMTEQDLMICDQYLPMCIAGVFGGKASGVSEQTHSVFLESACFHPTWIRKTARRQGLNTDASFRYERGVDPNQTIYILKLAAILVQQVAGGEIVGPMVDIYPKPVEPAKVELHYDTCDKLIGKKINRDDILDIVGSLEMEIVEQNDEMALLAIPTYRVDVTRQCDVIEDILRVYGYNNVEIQPEVRSCLSYRQFPDEDNALRNIISDQLTGCGFNEIMNNSLTAESYYRDLTQMPLDHCVRLLNPLSSDLAVMRQTLLFGGLESLQHNINRKAQDLLMYELGNVYFFNPQSQQTAEHPLEPFSEGSRLGLWLSGSLRQASWLEPARECSFFDLKGIVANILCRLNIPYQAVKLVDTDDELFASALELQDRNGHKLGVIGVVADKILGIFDIKQPVYFAELDWRALVKMSLAGKVEFAPLPRTQAVKRDLALLIDQGTTMKQVEKTVREAERKLLRGISLFDVYEGKNLPAGKKSYAIALTLQDDEKTLNDKQIDITMQRIIGALQKKLNAQLR